jgi:hypothetical protein
MPVAGGPSHWTLEQRRACARNAWRAERARTKGEAFGIDRTIDTIDTVDTVDT